MKRYREIVFTPAVEAVQEAHGSRALYARPSSAPMPEGLTEDERAFVAARNSFYVASINANGWPYIQHRGGPRGFVKVSGPAQLAFADYSGNRQYLTTGNLVEDDRVSLFFMDYVERVRLKMFARARTIEHDDAPPELLAAVVDASYDAKVERVFVFDVHSTSWNCPQHIVQRYDDDELAERLEPLQARIAELEHRLRQRAAETAR
jgi:predicted pyridoxine 5'-phosphate oxidase superfamily flavin-nucleotide-binding protein